MDAGDLESALGNIAILDNYLLTKLHNPSISYKYKTLAGFYKCVGNEERREFWLLKHQEAKALKKQKETHYQVLIERTHSYGV